MSTTASNSDIVATQSDGTLLAQVARDGSQSSFEILVQRHSQLIMNVCRRQLGDGHDAEDAAQAVFLVLWKKAATLQRQASVAGWLHHVARNVCRNAVRARKVRRDREQDAATLIEQSQQSSGEWDQIKEHLDDELGRMPEKYRLPIILFHLEGQSQEEIAALLATKRTTIAQRLSRGREMLRSRLARRGIALGVTALATTLTANVCSAAVPTSFAASTTQASTLFAAGKVAASGVLSAKAAALANGALKMLAIAKFNTAAAFVVIATLLTGGSVAVVETINDAQPRTIEAVSASQQDVQLAINSARDGDTVIVPAGTVTWDEAVRIDKGITLKGAGSDLTVITPDTDEIEFQRLLMIHGSEGAPFQISDIGFHSSEKDSWNGLISIQGTCKNWRINQCRFTILRNVGIEIVNTDQNFGVIDHCQFLAPDTGNVVGIRIRGSGDASWQQPLMLGSDQAVYVEDCEFTWKTQYSGALVAGDGARYVFRHNRVDGTFVVHGGMDSPTYRAAFSGEIYGNTFRCSEQGVWTAINFLGGTGVVFNNKVADRYGSLCVLQNTRSDAANENKLGEQGLADGSNELDGNELENGYPCCDQVGRTTDIGLGTPQQYSPLRFWANQVAANTSVAVRVQGASQHVQLDRDYIIDDESPPEYTPYSYPHPLTVDSFESTNESVE